MSPPSNAADSGASLTDQQKKVIAVALVVHLILLTLTWRDLRPPARRRRARPEAALAAGRHHEHDGLAGLLAVRAPPAARRPGAGAAPA